MTAYCLPIIIGVALFHPSANAMYLVTTILSYFNLAVHTPTTTLVGSMSKHYPSWMMTSTKHFYHHEKDVLAHFSAPFLDLDGVLGLAKSKPQEV